MDYAHLSLEERIEAYVSVLTKILTEFAKKCYILELKLILTIQSKFSLLELIFY